MSSLLYLAYEFADDFEAGVLANANCGGQLLGFTYIRYLFYN